MTLFINVVFTESTNKALVFVVVTEIISNTIATCTETKNVWKSDKSWEPEKILKIWKFLKIWNFLKIWKFEILNSLSWSSGHAEQLLFSCLCSKVTVYGRKLQCFFFDHHSSHHHTLSCYFRSHRAGSQLKILVFGLRLPFLGRQNHYVIVKDPWRQRQRWCQTKTKMGKSEDEFQNDV